MSQQLLPLAVWQSGTNENSIPANDNALRVEVLAGSALSIADVEPVDPTDSDQYVVGEPWGGFAAGNVVIYKGGAWLEFEAFAGWIKSIGNEPHIYKDGGWAKVEAGGDAPTTNAFDIVTEPLAFTASSVSHAGTMKYIRAGGNVTFDSSEGYAEGQAFNIRATSNLSLIGNGVTLEPTAGVTLGLEARMAVTVIMTSPTTADVIGMGVAP